MKPTSIQSRFLFSVLANGARGILAFTTNLILARILAPEHFGNLTFLLGSFLAVRVLLDMGTSNAFYTFMSQKPRGFYFVMAYLAWQVVQFGVAIGVIALLPAEWVAAIWIDHSKSTVLLAFAAVFFQQSAWQTFMQIGESRRLTQRVQTINLLIALSHLALILGFWWGGTVTVHLVFSLTVIEHAVALALALRLLEVFTFSREPLNWQETFHAYKTFCLPLVFSAWVGFAFTFADRWLLQWFGGAREQGFFGIGFQFATVCLLATTSMLRIFWKEIAEAYEQKNQVRVENLFHKISRFLFMIGALLSGFLIPWTPDLIRELLGTQYLGATAALGVLFLYPVVQTVGQIHNTMLLATGHTRLDTIIEISFMLLSIPTVYLLLASPDSAIPGLGLGALGIALKMVVLVLLKVNVSGYFIARLHGWKFDWAHQFIGLAVAMGLGWACHRALVVLPLSGTPPLILALLGFGLFSILSTALVWQVPGLFGLNREDLKVLLNKLVRLKLTG